MSILYFFYFSFPKIHVVVWHLDVDILFGQFFPKKYLQVVHPRMEEYLFGDLDQRDLVVNGVHPKTPLYEAFLKLPKEIWLVHR